MAGMETHETLARRAKDGDEAAFDELVRIALPRTYSFLARYMGDEEAAEDAAQVAFVKAWKNLRRYDPARPFLPWLLRIARNTANDALRGKRALPFSRLARRRAEGEETPYEETIPDEAPLPPELFERAEIGREVAAALLKLPERDRAVLILRYEEELPFEGIAATMGSPLNTVKSWHRRALARLRGILSEDAPERR
jgi:RNA polymerase sigma-70 factor (ECF subfamily)